MFLSGRADLHVHSDVSDGTVSPAALAGRMRTSGLRLFALTDHDTVKGHAAVYQALPRGRMFVPGVELTCETDRARDGMHAKLHILGLGCDFRHPAMQDVLRRMEAYRHDKFEARLSMLESRGMSFDGDSVAAVRSVPGVGKLHLAGMLVKSGYARDRREAVGVIDTYARYSAPRLDAAEAIHVIAKSGGVSVWAHPVSSVDPESFGPVLSVLASQGLQGLECWYGKYGRSACSHLQYAAKLHGLLVSGGSDFHGDNNTTSFGQLNADGDNVYCSRLSVLAELRRRGRIYVKR